ncbi:MAG: DUF1330 domain-containing protein [Acidimicrobiia bacterium]
MRVDLIPTDDQIAELAARADDGPIVMLNLNRYRDVAQYEPGHPDADLGLSGRDAYLRYGIVALDAVTTLGGRILWQTDARMLAVGTADDWYDEVVAVWYPDTGAFLKLVEHPGYVEAHAHRDAALERAVVLCTAGEPAPALTPPFG